VALVGEAETGLAVAEKQISGARRRHVELREQIERHLQWAIGNGLEAKPCWHEHPDIEPWRAARAALFTDPDAPLPE
jgi:hypothetical protein